jgi:hypothetical protein
MGSQRLMRITIQNLVDDFRTAIADQYYPESSIVEYLSHAQMEVARDLNFQVPLKCTLATVAYQEEYDVPDRMRKIKTVRLQDDVVRYVDKLEIERIGYPDRALTGILTDKLVWRYGDKIGLYYIPSDDASSTTLYSDLTSTATSMTCVYTEDFPPRGVVKVGNEKVSYTNIDNSVTTYTVFKGLARGVENTIATSHVTTDVVTWQDIELFGEGYPPGFINKPNGGSFTVSGAGGSIGAGVYKYQCTFYSTSLGSESLPYYVGMFTTASNTTKVSLSSFPVSTDADVDYIKLYRTKANGNIYYFHSEIANGTTIATDTYADASLGSQWADPTIQISFEYHHAVNYLSLAMYFSDIEEFSRSNFYKNNAQEEINNAIWNERDKLTTEYQQRGMPE